MILNLINNGRILIPIMDTNNHIHCYIQGSLIYNIFDIRILLENKS